MANAKFKFYGTDGTKETLLTTESHPKVDASQEDLSGALTGVAGFYDVDPSRVVLNSDTTVFSAN